MTKAHKAIDSHVNVVLESVSGLHSNNNILLLQTNDSAEFLKLIKSLEDDEFILAKCPKHFHAKPDGKQPITRYLLFIEGFGSLTWIYDHTEKGESK